MVEVVSSCAARMNRCLQVNGRALETERAGAAGQADGNALAAVSGHRGVGTLQCILVRTHCHGVTGCWCRLLVIFNLPAIPYPPSLCKGLHKRGRPSKMKAVSQRLAREFQLMTTKFAE